MRMDDSLSVEKSDPFRLAPCQRDFWRKIGLKLLKRSDLSPEQVPEASSILADDVDAALRSTELVQQTERWTLKEVRELWASVKDADYSCSLSNGLLLTVTAFR